MTDDVRIRVIAVLLKSLYKQNLITEDVYNHSLDNLPKTLDCGERPGYDVVKREVGGDNGCI